MWNNVTKTWHCTPLFFRLDSFPLLKVSIRCCYRFVVPSPLNVGVCKMNPDSAPQTLLQTWITLFHFSQFYMGILVEKIFTCLSLNLPFCIWHTVCFSQITGCSIGQHCPVVRVQPSRAGGECTFKGWLLLWCLFPFLVVLALRTELLLQEKAGETLSCCVQWCQLGRK